MLFKLDNSYIHEEGCLRFLIRLVLVQMHAQDRDGASGAI